MSNHLKISGKDLFRAMGKDPATYAIPSAPTPEEFLANPVATVFYKNFEPDFLAYHPLQAWFGGHGAAYLREWRKTHGPKLDRKGFEAWVQTAIWGNRVGLGCDMLDLRQSADRIQFAVAMASADPSPVPLAAEYLRIHCREEGSLGWTPPTGEERLGAYRAKVEEARARANASGPCLVTRGLPLSYASPAVECAARITAEAAKASGLVFDLLVLEPLAEVTDPYQVSHLYVVGSPESLASAAEADGVDEARSRVAVAGGYSVRFYGGAGAERGMADHLLQAFGWLCNQAEAHGTPIVGMVAM